MPTQTTIPEGIANKIEEVKRNLAPIAADGENQQQHFKYPTIGGVTRAMKPLLDAQGLQLIPHYRAKSEPVIRGDRCDYFSQVEGEFVFVDISTCETYVVTCSGSAADIAGRSVSQAISDCTKTFYLKTFAADVQEDDVSSGGSSSGAFRPAAPPRAQAPRQTLAGAAQAAPRPAPGQGLPPDFDYKKTLSRTWAKYGGKDSVLNWGKDYYFDRVEEITGRRVRRDDELTDAEAYTMFLDVEEQERIAKGGGDPGPQAPPPEEPGGYGFSDEPF